MEYEDLAVEVGNVRLEHFLMNGAGPRKRIADMRELLRSNSAAVVLGSITRKPNRGHPGPRDFDGGTFMLNSVGLDNMGWLRYARHLPELQGGGKPLWLNIAPYPFSIQQCFRFLEEVHESEFAGPLELNLSCPNNEENERIIACDPGIGAVVVRKARDTFGSQATLGVKLMYHVDIEYIKRWAEILTTLEVDFVVLGNTLPNTLVYDSETLHPQIKPRRGLAGMSGSELKKINIGLVAQFRGHFKGLGNNHTKIVGCGGISTGQDALEYLLAGADMCQVATAYDRHGPHIFDRILQEFIQLAARHGFSSYEDIHNHR